MKKIVNIIRNSIITAMVLFLSISMVSAVYITPEYHIGRAFPDRISVPVDMDSTLITFTNSTPADGAIVTQNQIYINTSVSNSSTAFIDWNNSLSGWWRFNNEKGEDSTFIRDWSGWGNNVTCLTTNCSTPTSGKLGNALNFDGSNDYLFTTSATRMPVTPPFTIESWVNMQNVSHWMDIFRKEGAWAVQIDVEGKINLEITGKQDTISNVVVPVNIWTYLAVTFEGTTVNFYKDGILTDTRYQINVPDNGTDSIYIGGYSFSNTYFNGTLDEIRIHNRVLNPEEIKVSYNAQNYNLYRSFTDLTNGIYNYKAYSQDLSGNIHQTQTRIVTVMSPNVPEFYDFSPSSPVNDIEGQSRTFDITVDQITNIAWYLNGVVVKENEINVNKATYTNASASPGTWNVSVIATNANGTVSKEWVWNVVPLSPLDGLLAYWKFDENTGTIVSDSSGNNFTGTIYGSTWTTGKEGAALQFDGIDDYVDVGSTLDLDAEFTIMMWARRNTGDTWRTLISKGESINDNVHNYVFYFTTTKHDVIENMLEFSFGDGTNFRTFVTTNIYDTNWHHLAIEFDSSNEIRIYVDGVLQSGTYDPNGIATVPATNSKKTLIGASSTTTEFFSGIIDEIKIYNRALTAEEIAEDYYS